MCAEQGKVTTDLRDAKFMSHKTYWLPTLHKSQSSISAKSEPGEPLIPDALPLLASSPKAQRSSAGDVTSFIPHLEGMFLEGSSQPPNPPKQKTTKTPSIDE